MLPFTTYNIPEALKDETHVSARWLWIVTKRKESGSNDALLQKIVTALKADMQADVYQIQIGKVEKISLSSLQNYQPKLVISFGVPTSDFGIWIDIPSQAIRFLEKFTFIQTMSLDELNQSPTGKKHLWNAMQIFMEMNKE